MLMDLLIRVMNLWVFVIKTCHQTVLHTWLVIWRPPLMLLSRLCAVLYEIYRPDNKPLSLMLPVNASVQDVMSAIVKPGGDHILIKMNSTGGGTCLMTYRECKRRNLSNCHVVIHQLSSDSSCCSLSVHYAQSVSVWTSHRKSSAQAGCHCSLHSPGAQWEALHLYKQPSGTIGKKWSAHHVIPVLT